MKPGDRVTVTNIDGKEAEGEIVRIHATTVSEYEVDFLDVEGATLLDYWRGEDVDPDAPVVTVALETAHYDYPADRLEVVDDG